jgi:hypothetical protein
MASVVARAATAAPGRCASDAGAVSGNPRPAAVAADRASAAGCGDHLVGPPERLDRLSGNESASGRPSAG